MKVFLKVICIGFVLVIAGAIGVTSYQFNWFKPQSIIHRINPENLNYFQESYVDCRKNFLEQVGKVNQRFRDVQISKLNIESRVDFDLTVDSCYIPAQKQFKRLLILTSGVHGVEGYVGSAVQQMVLKELLKEDSLDEMGVLLIHGINPYGIKYNRRVTENNVDLNRNCTTRKHLYDSSNKGYTDLKTFLNKRQKVNLTSFDHFFFQVNAMYKIVRYSMATLRQAVLQGQYQYEKGIYFGGKATEPSIKAVTPLIQQAASPYDMVFHIDLHTGYGENGTLHLIASPLKDEEKKEKMNRIFPDNQIDWGDSEDFYTITGEFTNYVGEIIPENYFLTMTFEFGTMDTQKTLGGIKALHNVIIENQGFHYGYKSQKDETGVKSRFLKGYYPPSETWRSKAIDDARQMFIQALKKYQTIDIPE